MAKQMEIQWVHEGFEPSGGIFFYGFGHTYLM